MKRGPFGRLGIIVALGLWASLPLAARAADPAEKADARSSPAAIRQYRDAAAFQNRGVYDLAADEWEKFLGKFPQDPLVPKAQHYLGVCRLEQKQYDAAAQAFQKVIANYPQFDLLDVTWLDLGLTQYSQAQGGQPALFATAAQTFDTVATKFPASKQVGQALYYEGEALYAANKKAEAADVYARVVEKFPDSPSRADALYALGITRQELNKPKDAGAAYDLFLKEFATHALRAEVILHRGETLLALGQPADAEKWFAAAAGTKDFALADLAAMDQGDALTQQKKYAEAAASYAAVPAKFPQSSYVPTATLWAGKCYYLAGQLADARSWLAKAAAGGGDAAVEAAHWLARVQLKEKQPAEAIKTADAALVHHSTGPLAAKLKMDRADALYDIDGRKGEALTAYAGIAKEFPEDPTGQEALYLASFTAEEQGDYVAAARYADDFLRRYPEHARVPSVKSIQAEAKLLAGDYPAAAQLYGELLSKYPQNADAAVWKISRGSALVYGKKYSEAVADLKALVGALKAPEQLANAHYLLGTAYFNQQKTGEAIKEFNASLAAGPKWRLADETLLALAAAYRQENKLPEAQAALRRLVEQLPQSGALDRAHYRLAEYQYAAGNYKGAAAEYQLVLDKWPNSPLAAHALNGLGWADMGLKDYAKAEQRFSQVIDKHADAVGPRVYYARALVREALKKYGDGIKDVQAYLKSKPTGNERSAALLVEGLCDVGLQKTGDAITALRSILTSDPGFSGADRVLYELAWALKAEKQEDAAAEAFARLAKEHPKSTWATDAQYMVGEAHYDAGRFAQAAEAYYAAMNNAGKSDLGEKAAYKLAWAYYKQGKYDEAQKSFDYQVQSWPQGELAADGQFMAAESVFQQGKYQPAWAAYQKVLAHMPAKGFQQLALLHAGQSAAKLEKWSDAAKLLQRADTEFPDGPYQSEVRYELGWCRQNQNDPDGAFKLYERAADGEGEAAAKARFMMGELLFLKKEHKEAVRQFFKVAYGFGYPQAPPAIREWQANAVFETARCFETMKQLDQARKSYQELIDQYPHSDKVADAKARLQALK